MSRLLLLSLMAVVLSALTPRTGNAQDEPAGKEADAKIDPELLQKLIKRVDDLESEVKRLRLNPKTKPGQSGLIVVLGDGAQGTMRMSSTNTYRWLALRVTLINLTGKEVNVTADDYELTADNLTLKPGDVPAQIANMSVVVGSQSHILRNLKTQSLKLPPGANGQTWLLINGLPTGPAMPTMSLKVSFGKGENEKVDVDVNDYFGQRLGLDVERIGPRDSLGLLTIQGKLDTLSSGRLIETLEDLVARKVARVVIRWAEASPRPDSNTLSWMFQVASQSGLSDVVNPMYPAVPSAIAEFHLVNPNPKNSTRQTRTVYVNGIRQTQVITQSGAGQRHVHATVEEAVDSAMNTAFEVLPRDELLDEIQTGHPLTRAAALATGGGRLDSEHLPIILRLADDNEVGMQRAALTALRHFGDPEAIEKLISYSRKNTEPLATIAVDSLAGSRYAGAHKELLKLLQEDTPGSRKAIVKVIARHARPIWSSTLYDFVKDKDAPDRAEALNALVSVGHPELFPLLKECLEGEDKNISTAALGHLVKREDRESETLALTWTLKHMESQPPTEPMNQLLTRTKDQRAVPLLLKYLEKSSPQRERIIDVLAQIGDETISQKLVERFDKLNSNEKRKVLSALYSLKSPAFRRLASDALQSSDTSLLSTACQLLQNDGSDESVQQLVKALEGTSNTSAFSMICNALSTLATNECRVALRKATRVSDASLKRYAASALQSLHQRSPAMIYVHQGRGYFRQKQHDKALQYYEMAVELDPELPEARSARAGQLLRKNKPGEEDYKKAEDDYRKLTELNPASSEGITGVGLVLVRRGKPDEAIAMCEKVREKFPNDNIYLYNMACLYGRAIEKVGEATTDAQKQKVADFQQKALADLKSCIEKGFQDMQWMKEDPDLKSLHGLDEFKKLSQQTK